MWFNTSNTDGETDKVVENFTPCVAIEETHDINPQHKVTHIIMGENNPPNIATIFPHVTDLSVYGAINDADFTRYSVRL